MYQKFIIILSFLLYFNCISQLQPETNLQNLADNWEIYIGPQSDHLFINQYTKENTELWKPVPIPSNLNDFIKWNPSNGEILLRKRFDFRNVADTSFSISLGKFQIKFECIGTDRSSRRNYFLTIRIQFPKVTIELEFILFPKIKYSKK